MNSKLNDLSEQCRIVSSWGQDISDAPYPDALASSFTPALMHAAQQEICSWDGYKATPVHALEQIAEHAGIASLYYKDESARFGLGSFKALGGAYAVLRYLATTLSNTKNAAVSMSSIREGHWRNDAASITVTSATDGNHGRSVAWGARQAGCSCHIFIHRDVSKGREMAMVKLGASITRIDGDYDESVRACAKAAQENGWQVISDTSYAGYEDVPLDVMTGYTMMVSELIEQLPAAPSHIIIQAGVGGLAAAVSAAFWASLGEQMPKVIIVESSFSACVQESLLSNKPAAVPIENETMMAGLSCGEISLLAWNVLSACTSLALSIDDSAVAPAMRLLGNADAHTHPIEAGECAVPGLIALLAIMHHKSLCQQLELNSDSSVLIFGCEGATDAEVYQNIMHSHGNN